MAEIEENGLKYVEFHVVDRCNLNCNGCSHFAPMVQNDYDHFDSFSKDIKRLRELVEHIDTIRLLGGEPFLDKDITRYILLARQLYPRSNIEIATNGLLVPHLSKNVLEAISENGIVIDVTRYPPTDEIVDLIHHVLEKNGISYRIQPLVKVFRRRFCPEGKADIAKTFKNCKIGRLYPFLYEGKLYLCSGPALVKHLNNYFNMSIEITGHGYDIHSEDASAQGIYEFLSHGNGACAYCGKICEEPWSRCVDVNNIDLMHWISEESCYFSNR